MHPPGHATRATSWWHPERIGQSRRVASRHVPAIVRDRPIDFGRWRWGSIRGTIAERDALRARPDLRTSLPPRIQSDGGCPSRHGQRIGSGARIGIDQAGSHDVRDDFSWTEGDVPGERVATHRAAGDVGESTIDDVAGIVDSVRLHAAGGTTRRIEGELARFP